MSPILIYNQLEVGYFWDLQDTKSKVEIAYLSVPNMGEAPKTLDPTIPIMHLPGKHPYRYNSSF